MPNRRTSFEHQILSDWANGETIKAKLARRYNVDRKTVRAVLARYGVQESEASNLGRMKKDTRALTSAMLSFINRCPPTPELVQARNEMVEHLGSYERRWLEPSKSSGAVRPGGLLPPAAGTTDH